MDFAYYSLIFGIKFSLKMKLNLFFLPITLLILVLLPVIYFWIYFLPQKWQVTISRIPVRNLV